MTCDDYQIAFDQQQAHVSSAISAAELHAHVATCAECAAYVSVSEQVSTSMMTTLARSPAPLDLDAILARVGHLRRDLTRSLVKVLLIVGVLMVSFFVGFHGFSPRGLLAGLVGAGVGGAVAYGVLRLIFRRRLAELQALESTSGTALIAGLRAELDRRIRTERQAWWLLPMILAAYHVSAFGFAAPNLPFLLIDICYPTVVLPTSIARYRRLVRERALLDG
jgi:hypothetical protein